MTISKATMEVMRESLTGLCAELSTHTIPNEHSTLFDIVTSTLEEGPAIVAESLLPAEDVPQDLIGDIKETTHIMVLVTNLLKNGEDEEYLLDLLEGIFTTLKANKLIEIKANQGL